MPPLPSRLSPDDLRVFIRVAERASFSVAAEQLGLPRATVSTAVQRLESRLGARLLQRTTRRVQLTADGQTLLERAQDLLADLDELQGLFLSDAAPLAGRLRVDMPLGVARAKVLPAIDGFLARHPGLQVEVCSTDRRVDPIADGFDCVLRVGTLGADGLVARPLGELPMASIASPAYVARWGRPDSLQALGDPAAGHHQVLYRPNAGQRPVPFEVLDDEGRAQVLDLPGRVTVDNSEAWLAACEAGLGIVQIPRWRAQDLIDAGRAIEILPDHPPPPMPVTLLYPHRRHLPRRVRVFMDWLAGLFTEEAAATCSPTRL